MEISRCTTGLHKNYLKQKLKHCPDFFDVVSSEMLCRIEVNSYPINFILLDDGHFTVLGLPCAETCVLFNSLGSSGSVNNHIVQFLRKHKVKHLLYNLQPIQTQISDKCGLFCIGFILFAVRNEKTFQLFMNLFDLHYKKHNDTIICHLLSRFNVKI